MESGGGKLRQGWEQGRKRNESSWEGGEGSCGEGLNIQEEQMQRLLDGKKNCLRKTYKAQTDANDKVWESNGTTETAGAMAKKYERPEVANRELCDAIALAPWWWLPCSCVVVFLLLVTAVTLDPHRW